MISASPPFAAQLLLGSTIVRLYTGRKVDLFPTSQRRLELRKFDQDRVAQDFLQALF